VRVGRECFPQERLCAPEFAEVETPQEACRIGRDFLRQIIRYAHERKMQVWLTMGEIPYVPHNLVPPSTKGLDTFRFRFRYCGVSMIYGWSRVRLPAWRVASKYTCGSRAPVHQSGPWARPPLKTQT
jgi:hypothetical protein